MNGYTQGNWSARNYKTADGGIWIDSNAFTKGGKALAGTLAVALGTGTGEGTVEANAALIAAAPDLLEALKAVLSVADRQTTEFDMARAAIAKAEGR